MANILLTTRCNRTCPYCFATGEMADAGTGEIMSWENLIYIADFLRRSGQRHVSLLGGEPTTHPQCVDFILYLLERDFEVAVFTNGILSSAQLEAFRNHLADVRRDRLTFVVNLNDPVLTPAPALEAEKVHEFLSVMGPWAAPGFNIYRPDYTLEFLFEAINRYGMKRQLRLGIAHPVPGQPGSFIPVDGIRSVIERLYAYRPLFDATRVRPGLDCGFPLCKISDEELGWLHRIPGPVQFGCGPALDISPDMSVYHCFPLFNYHRKSLFEFDSLEQIEQHFAEVRDQIKAELPGIYAECDGCRHQEDGMCGGGGVCQVLNWMMDEAPIRLPEVQHGLSQTRHPA